MTAEPLDIAPADEPLKTVLARLGVALPLTVGEDGTVLDADGMAILQIDPNCQLPDEEVERIALLVILAVHQSADVRIEEVR